MREEVRQKLLAELNQPGLPWQTGQNHAAKDKPLRWIPVADLTAVRLQLGISAHAWWVVIGPGSVTEFSPGTPCVFLLPVLEVPLEEARQLMKKALSEKGLPKDLIDTFPFEGVVCTGLSSHSERWASLAIEQVKTLPHSPELGAALGALAKNGPTQALRHGAQKVIAQLQSGI
jgi:hypothetical protein